MDDWYCIIDGHQLGPMSAEDLIALAEEGRLTPDDFVSQGGAGDWVKAEQVEGLFDAATATREGPPPVAPYRTGWAARSRIWTAGAALLVLVVAGLGVLAIIRGNIPARTATAVERADLPESDAEDTESRGAVPDLPANTQKATDVPPTVVEAWMHRAGRGRESKMLLYSNGRINKPDGAATWSRDGRKLELRWPGERAPGGVWIDRCQISIDGKSYSGRNQEAVRISGTLVPQKRAVADGQEAGGKIHPAAPAREQSKGEKQGFVTLSVPENMWVPVTWRTGSFFGGISYETPNFPVAYQRNGFAGKDVEIVSTLEAETAAGETLQFSASWNIDLTGKSGKIKCHWSDPMGERDYSGKGFLTIYLRRKGSDRKISNAIRVPLAIDEKYKQDYAAKYGPFSPME